MVESFAHDTDMFAAEEGGAFSHRGQRGACCAPTRSLTQAAPSCDWSRPRCHSGWYVIYSNKNILGKPHLTSWHSWIGFAALIGWIAFALAGALGLHPE